MEEARKQSGLAVRVFAVEEWRETMTKKYGYEQRTKIVSGFRPVVHARQGLMLGISQPLDGPIFASLEDAEGWCIHAMLSHFESRLGMSDARIELFKGTASRI